MVVLGRVDDLAKDDPGHYPRRTAANAGVMHEYERIVIRFQNQTNVEDQSDPWRELEICKPRCVQMPSESVFQVEADALRAVSGRAVQVAAEYSNRLGDHHAQANHQLLKR